MSLFIGLLPISGGIYSLLVFEDSRSIDYLYLLGGLIIIGEGLYNLNNGYLKVNNRTLKKNILFGYTREINLSKIISIEKQKSNILIKTESKKLKIRTELIDEKSLSELNSLLEKLNLKTIEKPVANI